MQTNMPGIKMEPDASLPSATPGGEPGGGSSWIGGMPKKNGWMPQRRPPHRGQGFMQQGLPRGGIQPAPPPGTPPGSGGGGVVGDWGPGGTIPRGDGNNNGGGVMPGIPMPQNRQQSPMPGILGMGGNTGNAGLPQVIAMLQALLGGRR